MNNALYVSYGLIFSVLSILFPLDRFAIWIDKSCDIVFLRIRTTLKVLSTKSYKKNRTSDQSGADSSAVVKPSEQEAASPSDVQTELDERMVRKWLGARGALATFLGIYISQSTRHGGLEGFSTAMLFSFEAQVGFALFRSIFTWMGIFGATPK